MDRKGKIKGNIEQQKLDGHRRLWLLLLVKFRGLKIAGSRVAASY